MATRITITPRNTEQRTFGESNPPTGSITIISNGRGDVVARVEGDADKTVVSYPISGNAPHTIELNSNDRGPLRSIIDDDYDLNVTHTG